MELDYRRGVIVSLFVFFSLWFLGGGAFWIAVVLTYLGVPVIDLSEAQGSEWVFMGVWTGAVLLTGGGATYCGGVLLFSRKELTGQWVTSVNWRGKESSYRIANYVGHKVIWPSKGSLLTKNPGHTYLIDFGEDGKMILSPGMRDVKSRELVTTEEFIERLRVANEILRRPQPE